MSSSGPRAALFFSSTSIMATVYAVAPRPTARRSLFIMHIILTYHHIQAGPSNLQPSLLKKKQAASPTPKRKRTDTPEGTSAGSPSPQPTRKPRDGPKKKKANRACYHCQKAHLTCDDCEFAITPVPFSVN